MPDAEKDVMPRRCAKHGHKWRQQSWGVVGTDVCARRRCTATRTSPVALPPWASPIPPAADQGGTDA